MQKTLEMQIQFLGQGDPLEKEMATHFNILAWRIPWMKEPGRLRSMRSQSQTRLSDFNFNFQLSKSVQMVTAAMKLKDTCSLEEKL